MVWFWPAEKKNNNFKSTETIFFVLFFFKLNFSFQGFYLFIYFRMKLTWSRILDTRSLQCETSMHFYVLHYIIWHLSFVQSICDVIEITLTPIQMSILVYVFSPCITHYIIRSISFWNISWKYTTVLHYKPSLNYFCFAIQTIHIHKLKQPRNENHIKVQSSRQVFWHENHTQWFYLK